MASRRDGSLQKEKVAVTFAKGVDQVTAEKLVVPGTMTRMENGVYNKVGEISKRNGYDDLNVDVDVAYPLGLTAPYDGPVVLAGESVGVLDEELLLMDGDRIFSRTPQDVNWTFKDLSTPINTRSSRVLWGQSTAGVVGASSFERFVESQHAYQCVYLNGYYVYVWADGDITTSGSYSTYYSIIDAGTGDRIVTSQVLQAGVFAYRLVTAGTEIHFVHTVHGTQVLSDTWMDTATLSARQPWPNSDVLATDVDPTYKYVDTTEIDAGEFGVAYAKVGEQLVSYIRTMRVASGGGGVTAALDAVRTTAGWQLRALSLYRDPNTGNLALAWVQNTGAGPLYDEYVQLIVWDSLLTPGAPGPWPVYGGLTLSGYTGVYVNKEGGLLTSALGSARHISVGPGTSDSFYSVIWDTNLDPGGTTWDAPYLACESKVVIRQCARQFVTTQPDYDIDGICNGIIGQLPLSSPSVNAGNDGYNPNIYYASLASRQFLRGDAVYFAVVQPTQPAQTISVTVPEEDEGEPRYAFPVAAIQDGIASSSYAVMRFSRVPVASAGDLTQYSQFGTCSCVGKLAATIAGGVHTQGAVSRVTEVEAGSEKWVFGGAEVALIRSDQEAENRNVRMTSECLIDMGDLQNRYESFQPNKARLTSGGVLSTYDGAQFTSQGWVFPPEIVWCNYNSVIDWGASMPGWGVQPIDPTYFHRIGVRAVYEWYDNQGQRHQSAPSREFVIWHYPTNINYSTTDGPNAHDPIQILVSIYGWLPKDTRVVFYWTKLDEEGLGPYYRSTSQVGTMGAPSTDLDQKDGLKAFPCQTLEDTVVTVGPVQKVAEQQRGSVLLNTDFGTIGAYTTGLIWGEGVYWGSQAALGASPEIRQIFKNEILYTNGDVVVNDDAPPSTCIEEWDERVWLGGLEVQNEIAFSKTRFPNEGVFFSDLFRLSVGSELTRVVGLHAMDDKLVVFKEDSIYIVYGQGPNDLGQGATYRAQLVTSDQGCVGPKSLIRIPTGVIFDSPAGLYRLGRGLQVDFIGARVEDATTGASVHGCELVQDKTQVRFMLSSGIAVVYDYLVDAWYTFTNHASVAGGACVIWKDNFSFLNAGGAMKVQNTGYLDDATTVPTYIPMLLETAWIKSGDVEGLQRVYKGLVLGDAVTDHTMTIDVGFDYDAYLPADTKVWTAADIAALPRYQLEIRPSRQRCQAMRFRMQDSGVPPAQNAGYVMTYLMLEVGIQSGLYRRYPIAEARK